MKTKNLFMILLAFLPVIGCSDFNQLVQNPNLPTSVPPNLIFTGVVNTMNDNNAWDGVFGSMVANQFWISTYTYYGTNNYDQSPFLNTNSGFYFSTLQNVLQMEQEASKSGAGAVNPYSALGKFFRAYYYNLMSQKFGELPLTDALKGTSVPQPAYNTQKEIYVQILNWLDGANTDLTALITKGDNSLSGDIYLGNDLKKWQKVVNAFTLRVLVSLSKKDSDADLNIKARVAAILASPSKYPIFNGLSDNLQYTYNSLNIYPKNPGNIGQVITRENISSTLLELTTSLKDPRTFVVATPAPNKLKSGLLFSDYNAYVGGSPGSDMSTLGTSAQGGNLSYVNPLRYYKSYDGSSCEASIIIGYPEMCFNIAEGINRGWASGNAATWYNNGITASMNFFGIAEGGSIPVGGLDNTQLGTINNVSIASYLSQPTVQYNGNNGTGLTQILQQKYISFWQNSNWEAYFNQRRTGVPTFKTGAGTGNGGVIPTRFKYPVNEASSNAQNVTASIARQFSADDLNGKPWIIQ
jgi:hypothetical protein